MFSAFFVSYRPAWRVVLGAGMEPARYNDPASPGGGTVDAADLKSAFRKEVRVRVRPGHQAMFVTGFGPFHPISENPSGDARGDLREAVSRARSLLRAVDAFLAELDPDYFDKLLLIGVAAVAESFRIETVARNAICPVPGRSRRSVGSGPDEPSLPRQTRRTLWTAPELLSECR